MFASAKVPVHVCGHRGRRKTPLPSAASKKGFLIFKKMNRAQNLAVLRPTHYMIRGKMMSTFGNQAGALASLVWLHPYYIHFSIPCKVFILLFFNFFYFFPFSRFLFIIHKNPPFSPFFPLFCYLFTIISTVNQRILQTRHPIATATRFAASASS